MTSNVSSIDDNNGVFAVDPPLARAIKFWFILFGVIFSILFNLLLFNS
jgi:hypothetical protein